MRPPLILGYHGIADVEPRHDPSRLFVPPANFESQVNKLLARGYEFLTCAAFVQQLSAGTKMDGKCVLTFDDGTSDVHSYLQSTLERLGVVGTVYVCPGLLGAEYPWCDPAANQRLMTEAEVFDVAAKGVLEIGAHTDEHTKLGDASAEEAFAEMNSCKRRLEELIGQPVLSFCYPACEFSEACPEAARRAGYTSAVTCGVRGSWDPFQLKRESLHTPDGPVTFALKSRGLYYGVRDLPPARMIRAITRPFRHRRERG